MKAIYDIAIDAGKALDGLAAIALLLSSRIANSNSAVLSREDVDGVNDAINESVDSLKRILKHATALGAGPVPPRC